MTDQIESLNFKEKSEIKDIMRGLGETLEDILLKINEKNEKTTNIKNICKPKWAEIDLSFEGIYHNDGFKLSEHNINIDVFCNSSNKYQLIYCFSRGYGSPSKEIECHSLLDRFEVSVLSLKDIPNILKELLSNIYLEGSEFSITIKANIYSHPDRTISKSPTSKAEPYNKGVFIEYHEDNLYISARIEYKNALTS